MEMRFISLLYTFVAYFAVCSLAFLGYTIYQMLPPMDWDTILKLGAGALFFCLNWYLIDDTLWS